MVTLVFVFFICPKKTQTAQM